MPSHYDVILIGSGAGGGTLTHALAVRGQHGVDPDDPRVGALALHGAVALTGGIPLRVDGEVVGAIGTSGETPDEDESVSIAGTAAHFSTVEGPALTQQGARQVAEAVGAAASARGVAPVVSVVDAGGELVYLWRPDQAQVASVKVTTDKARTAAIYHRRARTSRSRPRTAVRPRCTWPAPFRCKVECRSCTRDT